MKARVISEDAEDFIRAFVHPGTVRFPKFKYVPVVRWYQFWRVFNLFKRDYILSRAMEIIQAERMAEHMKKEIDAVRPMDKPSAQVHYQSALVSKTGLYEDGTTPPWNEKEPTVCDKCGTTEGIFYLQPDGRILCQPCWKKEDAGV